jgi:hypothetical protein
MSNVLYMCVLCEFTEKEAWNDLSLDQICRILLDLKKMELSLQVNSDTIPDICDYCVSKNKIHLNDYR